MQKYSAFLFSLLALVLSGNIMSMQISKKLSGKRYPIILAMRMFNKTYYSEPDNKSHVDVTSERRTLYRMIAQSKKQIKKLENIPLYDLTNETLIEDAIRRKYEIKMHKELIAKNEYALRRQSDEFFSSQKNIRYLNE